MRTVVETNSKKMTVEFRDIPDGYIECSHCGEWTPRESYGLNDEGQRTRTNCEECYMMDTATFTKTGQALEALKKDSGTLIYRMNRKIREVGEFKNGIPIHEFIEQLKKLPQDARILHSYCDEDGDKYSSPEVLAKEVPSDVYGNKETVYTIGY